MRSMDDLTPILYDAQDHVAHITINREQRKNALDIGTLGALHTALQEAETDEHIRIIVLSGTGESFCAGADLAARDTPSNAFEVIENHYKPVLMRIVESSKPVIAAVNGAAAGAGSALALVSDLVVMAEEAYLLFAFSNLGLIPDCGANWLLERAVGYKLAYQLAIEGSRLSAQECLHFGIANKVENDAVTTALRWAAELSQRAPLSLSLTKKVMRQSATSSYADMISLEGELQNRCMHSNDFREGVAAFFEKRQPAFRGQ